MRFGLASPADAPALARLQDGLMGGGWTAQELAELVAEPGSAAAHAAWRECEMIGFILCRRAADEAEILSIAVLPAERRQGIGSRLVEAAVGWGRAAGAKRLFLEVATDNAAALALYSKAGFSEIGRRRGYYGPGADALALRLDLEP